MAITALAPAHTAAANTAAARTTAARRTAAPAPAAADRHLAAVPTRAYAASERTAPVDPNPVPRGFALYVGLDDADPARLAVLVEKLRAVLDEEAPDARSHAAVALASATTPGRPIDLVRLALQEPRAVAEARATQQREAREEARRRSAAKVLIDTSRQRVTVEDVNIELTYKEFELLQALVLREGRTVGREELVDVLWTDTAEERPLDRTIDVHVRRLRKKLGEYRDIVRTVRGGGYRFDRHADVRVIHRAGPSPDRF